MATPEIYEFLSPNDIPEEVFSWSVDVIRGQPRDTSVPPRVNRDSQGNPIERFEAVYFALPAAVFPPNPSDVEVFRQRGVDLSDTVCFRQDLFSGLLPDIRHQDLIALPSGGSRRLEVLTSQDVGEAGLILVCQTRERRPGSG